MYGTFYPANTCLATSSSESVIYSCGGECLLVFSCVMMQFGDMVIFICLVSSFFFRDCQTTIIWKRTRGRPLAIVDMFPRMFTRHVVRAWNHLTGIMKRMIL